MKSPAQVVFEILRSKPIGVTSSTIQGHVMSLVTWPSDSPYAISYWQSFGTKPLSLTVSEIFNVKCNATVDVTLIRPLNKGQGHSFWYQSVSHIRLPMAINSNFCSRMHRLATIHNVTDRRRRRRRQTDRRNSVPIARPLVRSAKNMTKVCADYKPSRNKRWPASACGTWMLPYSPIVRHTSIRLYFAQFANLLVTVYSPRLC